MFLRDLLWILSLDERVLVKTSGIDSKELAAGVVYDVFKDILTKAEKDSIVSYITPQIDENGSYLEIRIWM